MRFGKESARLNIEEKNIVRILEPNHVEIKMTGREEVKRVLSSPIGTSRLKDIVKQGEKIVIITSDITRPMPSKLVLPEVLSELFQANIDVKDI